MAEAFRTAEQIGYDVAYVADHLTHPSIAGRWLADGFAVLAAAAIVTTRIDLGTLVASAVIRNPVTLARAPATVDDISGGRLVLGLGAGTAGGAVADRGSAPSTRRWRTACPTSSALSRRCGRGSRTSSGITRRTATC